VRLAEFNLAIKKLTDSAKNWPIRIDSFSYKDVTGIGTGSVTFNSPLIVITGKNSVGKTTFLRAIWLALDPTKALDSALTTRKLQSGFLDILIHQNGIDYIEEINVENAGKSNSRKAALSVFHIDSAEAISDLQQKLFILGAALDIVNGMPERVLASSKLDEIAFLTRREYESVTLYEVEIEGGISAPFFKVVYNSCGYDSTQMGSGEYASLFLWWMLDSAENGSIFLIEEPETFLSPLNQERLLSYLVTKIAKKKLCVVITSHSGNLLHNMPNGSVRFLERDKGGSVLVEKPDPTFLQSVGIYLKPDIFVFVEDNVAKIIGRLILERFDPTLARRCQLEPVGGEALITRSLTASMPNKFGLRFVGWYDGDQEGKIPANVQAFAALLPGSEAIETVLRKATIADPDTIGVILGSDRVRQVLQSLEGEDAHDWLWRFSAAIGRDPESVLSSMFYLWLRESANLTAAQARFDRFTSIATA